MKNDNLYFTSRFTENGFVFAPFNSDEKVILFPKKNADFTTEKLVLVDEFIENNDFINIKSSDKQNHLHLIENALDIINKNELKKVVISRKEEVQIANFDVLTTFKKLLQMYQNAFVYVWFHPKVGLWFGATPETLLQLSNQKFKTMSLAGTQLYVKNAKVVWKNKELEEQQLVTDFIENQLIPIASNLQINKTETIKAGELLHLRTKVEGVLNKNSSLHKLIRGLHPTPAVCGLPRDTAKSFINLNENYKRTYYTGFLGEISDTISELYVNLRCMSIADKKATIYVGGGITQESTPKKEWEETVSKSKTMKRIL
ncbi:isochorismate synthase [Polaribacter aquimarinus]|uniref:isochorismate synthase n=2 Tax=Polaribacter aquimarinus TaxID=2100726 RepID=A0A2U2J9L5_9FLAO|nr:isochorismate synthase [Polaribacter aquimarinus]